MRIYLLYRRALVEADEPMEEVITCSVVIGSSLVIGEVVLKGRVGLLLSEQVDLVQKKNKI
jgi:hypothetical protein